MYSSESVSSESAGDSSQSRDSTAHQQHPEPEDEPLTTSTTVVVDIGVTDYYEISMPAQSEPEPRETEY